MWVLRNRDEGLRSPMKKRDACAVSGCGGSQFGRRLPLVVTLRVGICNIISKKLTRSKASKRKQYIQKEKTHSLGFYLDVLKRELPK